MIILVISALFQQTGDQDVGVEKNGDQDRGGYGCAEQTVCRGRIHKSKHESAAVKADKENNTNESEYTFDLFHDKVLSLCVKYAGQAPSGVPGHRCAGPALCPSNSIPKITVYGKQNLVYN